jgi:hypothetical protein
MDEPSLRDCARRQLRGRRHAACGLAFLFCHGRFAMSAFVFCLRPALPTRGFWSFSGRFAESAFVFCLRPALPTRGFRSFHNPAMIGRHAGGPSEDCGEIIKQLRLRLQLRLEATCEVRGTIGSGKAEPLGELGQSGLCVAAA